ncbi:M23 family metallopeptidase [Novosphingobium album (ex Liu et al. 2023)]|uniref:M23 family metallopeptidase n=1 Tax=Novosphingobium album (ex Liu et al. 2023) TaxID=3031130 RepID=A0ABT5WNU4_9SPHN|nr:M23 family metallopeptidase [Novosphingobium album (ex Liu et al. 2023)]MDE8651714.1 M23 family metallopeptidase [Novosphingobium album (ex Liu et al. 2023)]
MIARAGLKGWMLGGLVLIALISGGASPLARRLTAAALPDLSSSAAAVPAEFTFTGETTQGGWIRGKVPAGTRSLRLDATEVPFGADGSFFVAFDRDAPPGATLVARLDDGRAVTRALTVAPRAWQIENVNIARREGGPTEAFMALRQPELARIEAARAMRTDAQGWRQPFIWPVKGRISGRFGSQRVYRGEPGSFHSGMDITSGTSGTPFVAPADGVVILAATAPFTLEGNLLMIDHGMGLNSAFLHCSQILVREGDHVKQGQVIGRIGMTGRATGPHLHWSMKWRDARIDPILLTGPMS